MTDHSGNAFDFGAWFSMQMGEAPPVIRLASDSFALEGSLAQAGPAGDMPGFYQETFRQWAGVITALQQEAPEWVGTGWACLAYFRKQAGDHAGALECAQSAKPAGLRPLGTWYCYDALVTALDELSANKMVAWSEAEEAIARLMEAGLPALASDFHLRYANLCHRQAGQKGPGGAGTQYLLQAINGICACIALAPQDCDAEVRDELAAIGRTVTRFGLAPTEYASIGASPEIRAIVEPHLGWPDDSRGVTAQAKRRLSTGAAAVKQQSQAAATAAGKRVAEFARERDITVGTVKGRFLEATDGVATLMDAKYRIPLTSIRFGWDPIIGVIPVVGDLVAMFVTCGIIVRCVEYKPPLRLYGRMALNTVTDCVVGFVPLAGGVFDVFFRANKKNIRLMENFIEQSEAQIAMPQTPESGTA